MSVSARGPTTATSHMRPRTGRGVMCWLVAGLQNVWVCAQGLQLIRADRIVSLLLPALTGHGAASPGDQHAGKTVCAEVDGGTEGDTVTRVKLADCGKSPAAEVLAGLAGTLSTAPQTAQLRSPGRGSWSRKRVPAGARGGARPGSCPRRC